jgi:hypothetical protein
MQEAPDTEGTEQEEPLAPAGDDDGGEGSGSESEGGGDGGEGSDEDASTGSEGAPTDVP